MRYAQIRELDISNGEGVGIALFVQGCHFHCKNCFNSETWDFSGGKKWTSKVKENFLNLIDRPYIKRVSILGGEPLADENVKEILQLISDIRHKYKNTKEIWLYSGYTWEECNSKDKRSSCCLSFLRQLVLSYIDVFIDGRYADELQDTTLQFRGSSNQRIIDVQKSLSKREIILWNSNQHITESNNS